MFALARLLRRFSKPARARSLSGLMLAALAVPAHAQTALEPDQGGIDYKIQGEYAGKAGSADMGAQIVALGEGKFNAAFHPGGLPGEGWRGTGRIDASGTLSDSGASFAGGGYAGSITMDGSRFTGKTDAGESFTFEKTFRTSPTIGAPPPAGSLVLFDGSGLSAWKEGGASMDARKLLKPEGAGAVTKQTFQDFTLHIEFREPFMPSARGQQRGNSGIFLQKRYEIQILDSFGADLSTGADSMAPKRECGAIWEHFGPKLNMSFPPLAWQTYDIDFQAARFSAAGVRTSPARLTVSWNGVIVHDKLGLLAQTLTGDLESASAGPLVFQFHGDPVYYRNIWITEGVSALRPGRDKSLRGTGMAPTGAWSRISQINGRSVGIHAFPPFRSDPAGRESGISPGPASGRYLFSGPQGTRAISYSRGKLHDF